MSAPVTAIYSHCLFFCLCSDFCIIYLPHSLTRFIGNYCDCCGRNIAPCYDTVQQIAKFFLYLLKEFMSSARLVKVCRATWNHVFILASTDFSFNRIIYRMLISIEKTSSTRIEFLFGSEVLLICHMSLRNSPQTNI